MNPKYDKRWKKGEDNYMVKDKFVCALDGVGGWIEVLIDSGIMTKQYIKHIDDVYMSQSYKDLKDILEQGLTRVTVGGSTTVVMAQVEDSDTKFNIPLKTCNLGDSGFLILRPSSSSTDLLQTISRSES